MAKKSRTPPPPRRVQAPKHRTTKREGLSDEQKRWLLYGGAGAGILIVVVVVALIAAGGGGGGVSDKGVATAMHKYGCTYQVFQAHQRSHVGSLNAKVKYNSFPPSNGNHYGVPAIWNFYTDPVQQVQAVHNLEHGGMLIEYGKKVPASTVAEIRTFYDESPNSMLVFPYAPLGSRVAFVAWTADRSKLASSRSGGYEGEGRVSICPRFDPAAAKLFRDHFRGKGPEPFPISVNTPGS